MTQPRVIIDVEALTLTQSDVKRLSHPAVAGVILFTRNYKNKHQLYALTSSIRNINPQLNIFVDQEGGRVQRFVDGFKRLKSMSYFGAYYLESPKKAESLLREQLTTMITELAEVGVSTTLMPVLDLNYGHNAVIGERSFGRDPAVVVALGQVVIDVLHQHHMPVTAKHFPGHGFVRHDSHTDAPIDERSFTEIKNSDLRPFQLLIQQCDYVMPSHVIYSQVDRHPAGFSARWIQDILRGDLGFSGQVMTDDMSMAGAAAFGSPTARAQAAMDAGCDLLLVCNNPKSVDEILESLY